MWKYSVLHRPHNRGSDLSVQYDTEASHGLLCFIKVSLPLMLSAGLCVLSPPGPRPLQGWERRLRLSFCLAISSFQKNRERRREHWSTLFHLPRDLSIHPSINPSVRHGECARHHSQTTFMVTQGSKSNSVSISRHSSTPLSFKVRVPLPVQFLLFKSTAAFLTTLDL